MRNIKNARWNILAFVVTLGLTGLAAGTPVDEIPEPLPSAVEDEGTQIDSLASRIGSLEQNFEGVEEATGNVVSLADEWDIEPSLAAKILKHAREKGIPTDVAFGLVHTESRFHPRAVSWAGALGLTQLMPATARWHKPGVTREQIFDVDFNLSTGFKHLAWLLERYEGDVRLALLAYNRGHGTVEKVLAEGGDPSNGYARLVLE